MLVHADTDEIQPWAAHVIKYKISIKFCLFAGYFLLSGDVI